MKQMSEMAEEQLIECAILAVLDKLPHKRGTVSKIVNRVFRDSTCCGLSRSYSMAAEAVCGLHRLARLGHISRIEIVRKNGDFAAMFRLNSAGWLRLVANRQG
jgi:hypothetical protein